MRKIIDLLLVLILLAVVISMFAMALPIINEVEKAGGLMNFVTRALKDAYDVWIM